MMPRWKRKMDLVVAGGSVDVMSIGDFRQQKDIKKSVVEMTYAKLCVATAKAMLTNAISYSYEIIGFARSYFHVIPYLIAEKNGYLVFDNDNKDVLRDFSKSTRIGELAQGIHYQMCIEQFGAYAVYDYKEFVKEHLKIKKRITGRSPDYVLCYKDGTYGIIESKGTLTPDPTPFLKSGNEQIKSGSKFLNDNGVGVKNSYTATVSFATSSKRMHRNTTIYMADPDGKVENRVEMRYKDNVLRECAKFLCIAGDLELANMLKKGTDKLSEVRNVIFQQYSGNEDECVIGEFSMRMGKNEIFNIEMGLSDKLVQYILQDTEEMVEFESYIEGDKEYFSDGTFVRIRKG